MTDPTHPAEPHHGHPSYVKIWGLLVVLLAISIVGPMFGMTWLTLVTAFGIALVKALMVTAYFMHLNVERMYVKYLMIVLVGVVLVFFAGVAPDVMKAEGQNWRHAKSGGPVAPARH
jgi:caa(3)-type oxidase subunit IV